MNYRSWLDSRFGPTTPVRSGGHDELVYDCPFCGSTKRLWVNADRGAWCCYRCGEGSPHFLDLYARVEQVPFAVALKSLMAYAKEWSRGELEAIRHGPKDEPEEPELEPDLALPDEYIPVWDAAEQAWNVVPYLKQRGVTLRTSAKWQLGYCLTGRYAQRVVMPIQHEGGLLGFTSRTWNKTKIPKYLTPEALPKDRLLYGSQHLALEGWVLVVEGPFDALLASQAGFPAVALQGKSMGFTHVQILKSLGVSEVVIMLDGYDPTAASAAHRIYDFLQPHFARVVNTSLPDGYDAAKAVEEGRLELIDDAIRLAHAPTPLERVRADIERKRFMEAQRMKVAGYNGGDADRAAAALLQSARDNARWRRR